MIQEDFLVLCLDESHFVNEGNEDLLLVGTLIYGLGAVLFHSRIFITLIISCFKRIRILDRQCPFYGRLILIIRC